MIVGIDLGTTNSLIAVWEDSGPRLIPNSLGEVLTPSCVSLDEDGTILVGRAARERLQTHPDKTAAVFKRFMGSDRVIRLGKKEFRAEELSALILRALKEDAEAAIGQTITEAIITVPAYFSEAQRKATRAAGQLAGLKVERLLNEPTAAALAYGIHQRDSESRFLVFDLGGGTFDVSVLDLFEGVMEVRASAGDNFLGGEDFVFALNDLFFEHHKLPAKFRNDATFMQRLTATNEAAKRALSEAATATVKLQYEGKDYVLELDEAILEKIWSPLLSRLRDPVERALRDSNFRASELDSIVLAGGATRMPAVRKLVSRMFGRFPENKINPDEVVALGAAVQAGLKMKNAALNEIVMTDVAPYSLGIEISVRLSDNSLSAGHFDPIIERNSIIPVSKVKSYVPIHDKQTELDLNVFQGEARMVRDNIKLGSLTIPLGNVGAARDSRAVDVRFTYDVNGLLQVEATASDDKKVSIVIEGNPGMLTEQEIATRLAALSELKIHPRDKLESRTLLARAERLYQLLKGQERDWLGWQIAEYERILNNQDVRQISAAQKQLETALNQIEHHDYLANDTDPAPDSE